MTTDWITTPCEQPDESAKTRAIAHQQNLTKPPGSLGRLEDIAVQFAAWQNKDRPQLQRIYIRVFAADHGVCKQGVSAFPQAVTQQMIMNFIQGGAAISVLARQLGADFTVINMGTINPTPKSRGLVNEQIAAGTNDFSVMPAMTEATLADALLAGRKHAPKSDTELFIGGEMGIGNTTAASAIYSSLLALSAESSVGPGTGLDQAGVAHKCAVVNTALTLHTSKLEQPLSVLQHVGGLEIAALVGAYITSAQRGVPILVDGFICTAAALLAVRLNPSVKDWMLFAHRSAEPAHRAALEHLQATPLLDLGMRLGEGSGAALAVSLLQSALQLHVNMATFEQAGVSNRD